MVRSRIILKMMFIFGASIQSFFKLLVHSIPESFSMLPARITTAIKALRQLGFTPLALNVLYKVGLKTGYFKINDIRNRIFGPRSPNIQLSNLGILIPSREQLLQTLGPAGLQNLLREADEIVAGRFRQFGAAPVEINLIPPPPLLHWTDYENHKTAVPLQPADLKLHWEPARFGWAFVLGRAYHASADEKYAEAFWRHFETFQTANPPNMGPNWMSGQEVGLRLMAFAWAGQIFAPSKHSTPERLGHLATAIAQHATRIPPTLIYARSQNNNHLLTEAAALYTASLVLPTHPDSAKWQAFGQRWQTWCFAHQIDRYGEYVQHSANYHRLMLQTALWVRMCQNSQPTVHRPPPALSIAEGSIVQENLALATHWLLSLLDPASGRTPNLGANDGALIFPLSTQPFEDFRPVAQAAARSFLGYSLPPGPWDEMSLWFGAPPITHLPNIPRYPGDHIYAENSWGYLRAVKLSSRPSHADQLHFDLWWRGLNIAQDAGTYLYNAAPPWDNQLTNTLVHNTVSVNGQEQMTRAGRFLYLDWANASSKRHFESGADFLQRASAQTDAYLARFGVHHTRTVTVFADERWVVEDDLQNTLTQPHRFRLHWLLPDGEWKLENGYSIFDLRLQSPDGWVTLHITGQPSNLQPATTLVRAGEYLYGSGPADPVRGWVASTYAQKAPALSLAIEVESSEHVKFISEFKFPKVDIK